MKASSSRYRKIHCMIWNDDKFPHLSTEGKVVFFLLLTTTFSTPFGAYKAGKAALEEESRIDAKGFAKGFSEVLSKGMAKYNETARFIFLPNFLKHNQPANPNVVKSWGKIFNELPDCELKALSYCEISACCERLGKAFTKGFAEGFPKGFTEGYANTGTGTGTGTGTEINYYAREGNEPFKMFPEWEPSEYFNPLAERSGIAPPDHERLAEMLQQFIPYWMTKDRTEKQHGWDLALVRSIKQGFYDQKTKRPERIKDDATDFDSVDYQAGATKYEDLPEFLKDGFDAKAPGHS